MKQTLWTKNFSLLIGASILGAAGGIAGSFALSFLVFDETGSTLASALILAAQIIPGFLIPLAAAPWMDRLPRKPVLVAGDALNGLLYGLGGLYLLFCPFSYIGYLCFSLLLASLSAFDSLAYNSIYPKLIPEGMEQKGYTVSGMLYPVMQVVMMPVAALLLERLGAARILLLQGLLSFSAAVLESRIRIQEERRLDGEVYSFRLWKADVSEALSYLRQEKGLSSIFSYMAVTNGVAVGYGPLLVAFFRMTAGFTTAMYSFFSLAEFIGRSLGGLVQYRIHIPPKKRFPFIFGVYQIYECMDLCLLWLPYPLMLINRAVCGFLGINSATLRQTAVQQYIPEELRARLNAYQGMLAQGAGALLTLLIGFLGEILDLRLAMSCCAVLSLLVCWSTVWKNRSRIRPIFETQSAEQG